MTETLAQAHAPLVLADGTVINPSTGRPEKEERRRREHFVEVPNAREAQAIISQTRRRVADLPEPPKTMNAISVVLTYTLFGLSPQEVAVATTLTAEQVVNIQGLDAYKQMEAAIVQTVLEADAGDVQNILSNGARNAARRVIDLIDSEDDNISLAASKDVLSRTGHSSRDGEAARGMDSLNIRITVQDQNEKKPTIEISGGTL